MALSWILHNPAVTTVLIGASRPEQIVENVQCIQKIDFSEDELAAIEAVLSR
jgi:L-glyceraldehyde 3-phosphate reductase